MAIRQSLQGLGSVLAGTLLRGSSSVFSQFLRNLKTPPEAKKKETRATMGETEIKKNRVELHLHLDGAVRPSTLLDAAKRRGIPLPADTIEGLLPHVSMDRPDSLVAMIKVFKFFIPIIQGDGETIKRIAYELCEDQAKHGVLYFEARYCPHFLTQSKLGQTIWDCPAPPTFFTQTQTSTKRLLKKILLHAPLKLRRYKTMELTPTEVVELVNSGLNEGSRDFGVKARSILCLIRDNPEFSMEMVQLCDRFRNQGVVAIDLAGNEVGDMATNAEHIKAFQEAKRLGIHRTVHAGEIGGPDKVEEAVFKMDAERIGHGYHILEDPQLYAKLRDMNMHFEVCPVSSYITGAVPPNYKEHPALSFAKDGANFSINSDDPSVFRTHLSREYDLIREHWNFDDKLIAQLNLNAAEACFLPQDEKTKLIQQVKEAHGIQ
ncbi:adenosine deaminase-like isoform X1 [Branchiostoma lanceolatum]|uniref:adenosine deaminase-like isoform X1 n=1 Tax=Branchiostoma lanceolatum TaxID=7740 RepID=UPI0034511E7C